MRAIISREKRSGCFPEVGMNDRTICAGASVRQVLRKAQAYAKGKPFRAEWFSGDSIRGEPYAVTFHQAKEPC